MLIICFLRRVSEPVAALLAAFLSEEDAKRVDVVLLDSARGLTADRVHVIFSSRFVGSYDQLEGIQADPSRLYVAYTRGRLATTVWMEQEPLGLPSGGDSEDLECWRRWMPEFENHPAKKSLSPTTQQWIEFAAKRHALLSRGEVEPSATGSAHSAPSHSHWNMSSAHQTFTWRALVGTTREHFEIGVGYAWNCQIERSLMRKVDTACEEAQKKVLSLTTSTSPSLASIVQKVVLQGPVQMVRDPPTVTVSVDPTKPEWLHKAIKFAMLVPNAVAISLGDKGRVRLSVPYADLPGRMQPGSPPRASPPPPQPSVGDGSAWSYVRQMYRSSPHAAQAVEAQPLPTSAGVSEPSLYQHSHSSPHYQWAAGSAAGASTSLSNAGAFPAMAVNTGSGAPVAPDGSGGIGSLPNSQQPTQPRIEQPISKNKSPLPKLSIKGGDPTTLTRIINEWIQKTAIALNTWSH